ncbi:MAG: CRISPR-associated helicase Cas3' [Anaerolineae bacterium]
MSQHDAFEAAFKILNLIKQSEDGLTTTELGVQLGISRQTALKYIQHLIRVGFDLYESERRWHYREQSSIMRQFSRAEQTLLHLILERSLTIGASDSAIYGTLYKLASKFEARPSQPPTSTSTVFDTLVEARHKRRAVEILYQGLRAHKPTLWHIKPIRFIMPVWSDAVYLFCAGCRPPSQSDMYLTLKLNRILRASLLYEIGIIEQHEMFKRQYDAWLVWQSDRPSVEVIIYFAGHLHRRLLESRWHTSQQLDVMHDGRIKASFHVAEPQEMLPWIRSWGADAEIVAPESLREAHIRELARALDGYHSPAKRDTTPVVPFWAKYDRVTKNYHVLDAHLLDVAAVAWAFWEVFSPAQRQWLSEQMTLSEDQARRWIAFLAGAHDVGKASPGFQQKAEGWSERLERVGYRFVPPMAEPHGVVTALTLAGYLKDKGMRKAQASNLAFAVGSHHGHWVSHQQTGELDEVWQRAEYNLLDMLWDVLGIHDMPVLVQSALISGWLAGFVSVVDWIGSQDKYFPFSPAIKEHSAYFAIQCEQAAQVLSILGFFPLEAAKHERAFHDLFGFKPNLMQQAIIDNATDVQNVKMVIIEAPTGDGKTEAALYLAQQLLSRTNKAGLYIAMPTRATSNQLFERTQKFLAAAFPNQALNYHLIHSQAEDHELYKQLISRAVEGNEDSVAATEWFQPRKRSLLARLAVGTVDQAMLAVLKVKHFFVRVFALSHKVVIVDEVHAYDTYMSTIQERLLHWLDALQSPTILLSATLPAVVRQRLLGAQESSSVDVPYPRATVCYTDGTIHVMPLQTQRQRTIYLRWIDADVEALLREVTHQLEQGGCAAVICNTVNEAQQVYAAAINHPAYSSDEVMLFHARFPAPWRDAIEKRVVSEFGKTGPRPKRRLLIATQIIEQSLDLDFDVLVSAVAPVDLLIQRFGRLHRHERTRPPHLRTPLVLLREPQFEGEAVSFEASEYIYHRYVLLQTYGHVRSLEALVIPRDIEPLIEKVYASEPMLDPTWPDWFKREVRHAYDELKNQQQQDSHRAKTNLIPLPTNDRLTMTESTIDVTGDDAVGKTPSITTRLVTPSVRVICLHKLAHGLSFEPDEMRPCRLDNQPDAALVREMLRYSVTVQHRGVRQALMQQDQHPKLAQTPQLDEARIVIFERGIAQIGDGLRLCLTKELGLVIEGDQE